MGADFARHDPPRALRPPAVARPPARLAVAGTARRSRRRSTTTRRSQTSCSARASRRARSSGSGTSSSVPRSTFRAQRRVPRWGSSPCRPHCFPACRAGELVLPTKPLGWMHGDAARRTLERRGDQSRPASGSTTLDDVARRCDRGCDAARGIGAAARRSGAEAGAVADRQRASPVRPAAPAHAAGGAARLGCALGLRSRALTGIGPSKKAPIRDSGPGEGVWGNREVPPWPAERNI